MVDFESTVAVAKMFSANYNDMQALSKEQLLMLIGMMIDYHSSAHDGDPAEYISTLSEVSKLVNETEGKAMAGRTV